MRILVAEDDKICARILVSLLKPYGEATVVADGEMLIRAVTESLVQRQPFSLICLDIKMPELDGQVCLKCIRAIERGFGKDVWSSCKIIMTTGVQIRAQILDAFRHQCEGYLVKPIERVALAKQLSDLGFNPM